MKMEDVVRKQHEMEDRINAFLGQIRHYIDDCLTMDLRTMEIGMARIYDLMNEATNEVDRLDKMFKGKLFKTAYDRKQNGERAPLLNRLGGSWGLEGLDQLISRTFKYPIPLTEQFATDWSGANPETIKGLIDDGKR